MADIFFQGADNIKGYDCNAAKQKRIIFEGSFLKVVSGSQTLYSLDLSGFGQFGSEFGGSFKKSVYIPAGGTYTLNGGNISQQQGEVAVIVLGITYDRSISLADRYITVEYKGSVLPCNNLMFLTGVTKEDVLWHGWDLESYVNDTSPSDPSFGGMLLYNPTSAEVEVQILVMN